MVKKVRENENAALKEFLLKVYKYQLNTGQKLRANATLRQINKLGKEEKAEKAQD